jgi:flavin prenyltransferase
MHKIVVAITGASGSVYAQLLINKLLAIKDQWTDLAVVMTENAREVWRTELDNETYADLPVKIYNQQDFHAPFASGSGQYDTMIIIPCSMGTLGRIATGISSDLITRAADVILKERRKLICVVRDTPYNHLPCHAIFLQQAHYHRRSSSHRRRPCYRPGRVRCKYISLGR